MVISGNLYPIKKIWEGLSYRSELETKFNFQPVYGILISDNPPVIFLSLIAGMSIPVCKT